MSEKDHIECVCRHEKVQHFWVKPEQVICTEPTCHCKEFQPVRESSHKE